jgi:uncharacterized protein YjbI with pentapeptide repeats
MQSAAAPRYRPSPWVALWLALVIASAAALLVFGWSSGTNEVRGLGARPALRSALTGVDLSGQTLPDVRLRDADLRGSRLRRTVLVDADLGGAVLSGVQMQGALLSGANLRSSRLVGTWLERADLAAACLRDVVLLRAHLDGANLSEADVRGADLRGAQLGNTVRTGLVYDGGTQWPLATVPSGAVRASETHPGVC